MIRYYDYFVPAEFDGQPIRRFRIPWDEASGEPSQAELKALVEVWHKMRDRGITLPWKTDEQAR